MFHQFPELNMVGVRHNSYNTIRGEIDLLSGFTTAITKNAVIQDDNWLQLLSQINEFLNEKNLIKKKTYPDSLPEHLLRDRMAAWLETNQLNPKKEVVTEFPVGDLGDFIDIFADKEAWELKRNEAAGLDVYQLFAYMDMTGTKKGFLLAESFKSTAESTKNFINSHHGVEIVLTPLSMYPINHPPTAAELEHYF